MSKFENSPPGDAANKLLEDAKSSFKSCIDLEGKPASGETPDLLVGQQWWQERLKAEEEKKKAAESKTAAKPTAGAGVKGGPAAGRGAPAPRGRGAATTPARGGPAGRSGPARGGATAPARGGARGAAAGASRGGAATTKAGPPAAKTGSSGTVKAVKSGHNCTTNTVPASTAVPAAVPSSEPSKKESPSSAPSQVASKPAPLNKKRYHPRLGLARAMRASGDSAEAKKYYSEVIAMAPEVHDAYIESAEMLTKSDPLAAVDIYSKFPVPEEPSFDDAYIFGEIMRLLMKHEKYDDPRLAPNMIAYGRVMGIGALEKHVNKLEELFKADLLKTVYAGVNRKDVDDPDLQAFFKFKCWI